jgi:hypothetical protein
MDYRPMDIDDFFTPLCRGATAQLADPAAAAPSAERWYNEAVERRRSLMTFRGTVHKGVVVLEPGATLPEGTPVTVVAAEQPVRAQPVPIAPKAGSARGKVRMSTDFDEPLPDFGEYME